MYALNYNLRFVTRITVLFGAMKLMKNTGFHIRVVIYNNEVGNFNYFKAYILLHICQSQSEKGIDL